jgi:hypothetical protein
MEEFSKKLWCSVDYQGGQNVMGAASLGYNVWNNRAVAGKNTVNLQVDINFYAAPPQPNRLTPATRRALPAGSPPPARS